MPLSEEIISGRYHIDSYAVDSISIANQEYHDSLLVAPDTIVTPWPVHSNTDLVEDNLKAIIQLNPEIVLLGTGPQQEFPDISVFAWFASHGLGLEVMNTGALCRTFNILVAEDRQVVAAFIQPQISSG